jgi:hypothetical protein
LRFSRLRLMLERYHVFSDVLQVTWRLQTQALSSKQLAHCKQEFDTRRIFHGSGIAPKRRTISARNGGVA